MTRKTVLKAVCVLSKLPLYGEIRAKVQPTTEAFFQQLEEALPWVKNQLAAVQKIHPKQALVLGETGWATSVHDQGEQAELIKGQPGEAEQKIFHDSVRAWADSTRQVVFFFEAFDENWKGGGHPAEVEKHWGVFRADRTIKR